MLPITTAACLQSVVTDLHVFATALHQGTGHWHVHRSASPHPTGVAGLGRTLTAPARTCTHAEQNWEIKCADVSVRWKVEEISDALFGGIKPSLTDDGTGATCNWHVLETLRKHLGSNVRCPNFSRYMLRGPSSPKPLAVPTA